MLWRELHVVCVVYPFGTNKVHLFICLSVYLVIQAHPTVSQQTFQIQNIILQYQPSLYTECVKTFYFLLNHLRGLYVAIIPSKIHKSKQKWNCQIYCVGGCEIFLSCMLHPREGAFVSQEWTQNRSTEESGQQKRLWLRPFFNFFLFKESPVSTKTVW